MFPNSRANNPRCSGLICPIIKLIRDLMGLYTVVNICRCQSVNKVKYEKFSYSRVDNSNSSDPICVESIVCIYFQFDRVQTLSV